MDFDSQTWNDYAEALAFAGNSLLAPMGQTGAVALDSAFWDAFPDFGSSAVAEAIADCRAYAADAQRFMAGGGDAVQRASVEYTKLFIGPPRPTAAPWETMYRAGDNAVGFGEATFEMQRLLRGAGLEISNENNQYADHIGIELLYLSVLCERAAQGGQAEADACASFAAAHPLTWIGKLRARVSEGSPNGYYVNIFDLAESLLHVVAS